MITTTLSPVEFDTALAALYGTAQALRATRARLVTRAHHAAGDRKTGQYGRRTWAMTEDQAVVAAGTGGQAIAAAIAAADAELTATADEIDTVDEIYRQAPWSRFILCLSAGGHIHNAAWCSTLRYDTAVQWRPELSGATVAAAVAVLGEALCSVCYPSAPVAFKAKTLTQVERERTQGERDAAAAAKAAVKGAKALRPDEQFRTAHWNERVTTVYALKELIRKPVEQAVELAWYATPEAAAKWDGHPAERFAQMAARAAATLAEMEADAAQAERVLLAREAEHAGWGATAAEIARMRANKERAARKAWGLPAA